MGDLIFKILLNKKRNYLNSLEGDMEKKFSEKLPLKFPQAVLNRKL